LLQCMRLHLARRVSAAPSELGVLSNAQRDSMRTQRFRLTMTPEAGAGAGAALL